MKHKTLYQRLNFSGKIIFAIGFLSIFIRREKVNGFCFGGCPDNSWEIIFTSILISLIGLFLISMTTNSNNTKNIF